MVAANQEKEVGQSSSGGPSMAMPRHRRIGNTTVVGCLESMTSEPE
jgi:hypothetical protein